jgi:hypothetical protein
VLAVLGRSAPRERIHRTQVAARRTGHWTRAVAARQCSGRARPAGDSLRRSDADKTRPVTDGRMPLCAAFFLVQCSIQLSEQPCCPSDHGLSVHSARWVERAVPANERSLEGIDEVARAFGNDDRSSAVANTQLAPRRSLGGLLPRAAAGQPLRFRSRLPQTHRAGCGVAQECRERAMTTVLRDIAGGFIVIGPRLQRRAKPNEDANCCLGVCMGCLVEKGPARAPLRVATAGGSELALAGESQPDVLPLPGLRLLVESFDTVNQSGVHGKLCHRVVGPIRRGEMRRPPGDTALAVYESVVSGTSGSFSLTVVF